MYCKHCDIVHRPLPGDSHGRDGSVEASAKAYLEQTQGPPMVRSVPCTSTATTLRHKECSHHRLFVSRDAAYVISNQGAFRLLCFGKENVKKLALAWSMHGIPLCARDDRDNGITSIIYL